MKQKQSTLLNFFRSIVKDSQESQQQQSEVKSSNQGNSEQKDPDIGSMMEEPILNNFAYGQSTGKKRLRQVVDSDEDNYTEQKKNQEQTFEMTSSKKQEKSEVKQKSLSRQNNRKPKQTASLKEEKTQDMTNIIQETKGEEGIKQVRIQLEQLDDFDDATPIWARSETSRDKQQKLHQTQNGDPTTLYIPTQEYQKLTKSMQQYWKLKSENFDKIIFFKLGKFYELFYDDAMVGHRELDLNWMGRKMYTIYEEYQLRHTGFPEKCLSKYSRILVERGYKIAVVEQVETPEQMQRRITENKKSGIGEKDKIVLRELTQVLTKGTIQDEENQENVKIEDERLLMVIKKEIISLNEEVYGIVILESQTNKISLAKINNSGLSYLGLKTLITQCKPLEVVIDPQNIRNYDPIYKILKSQIIQTQISYLRKQNDNWDGRKAIHLFGQEIPQSVIHFQDSPVVLDALSGLFCYLDTILLKDRVLESARFQIYDQEKAKQKYMILDSQSLFHLEIISAVQLGLNSADYSLFGCLDRTITPGGRRILRKWVCAPLFDIEKIKERQDAIEDLIRFSDERVIYYIGKNIKDAFRKAIKKLPDIERICAKTYSYSVKTNSKAIYYEDISTQRLKDFRLLCTSLRNLNNELIRFIQIFEKFKSKYLRRLFTVIQKVENKEQGHIYEFDQNEDCGLLPDIIYHLDDFENYIKWKDDVPKPVIGILQEYDESEEQLQNIKEKLEVYLNQIKKRMNEKSIQYAHAKYRYELEIPSKLVEKYKPDDFEFTSAKSGFQRFHTQELKDMIQELERAEERQKKQLTSFVQYVFKHFQKNYRIWDRFITTVNELDALSSLSVWSQNSDGVMCKPEFTVGKQHIQIIEGRHPCLTMTGLNFIPNSINLGSALEDSTFLLLTGPNMGGKSTTLRMVCVLVIIAQLGAYVPAQQMSLSPVDKIFTRLGAKDQLMEGKSTFYIELEETQIALTQATVNSLFIVDELGRGTSTYDGVAIAYSVMKYMVDEIKCLVLFATHFRVLVEEAKLMRGIKNYHMGCYVEEAHERVVFLYKLRPGECPASFGINVARATGIQKDIIEKAKIKAQHFEQSVGIQRYQDIIKQFNQIIKTL